MIGSLVFFIVSSVGLYALQARADQVGQRVLAEETGNVTVSAQVPACIITLTVYPEKRVPPTGNWGTDLTIDIYNSSNQLVTTFNATSNNQGQITYDVCDQDGLSLGKGVYTFYVRGKSHLRKIFGNITTFDQYASNVNLAAGGQRLLAGETSIVYDNYVNGLDLSTQVEQLYTGDDKNDLNQDGAVNALDLAITVTNLYKFGD